MIMPISDYLLRECRVLENEGRSKIDDDLGLSQYSFICESQPDLIVEKIKEILLIIDRISISGDDWPTVEEWKRKLPGWFISKFLPDRTEAQKKEFIEVWDSMDFEKKNTIENKKIEWRFKNWIYYFDLNNRDFFIENMEIGKGNVLLTIVSLDLPFSVGPIDWLIRVSGGSGLVEVA